MNAFQDLAEPTVYGTMKTTDVTPFVRQECQRWALWRNMMLTCLLLMTFFVGSGWFYGIYINFKVRQAVQDVESKVQDFQKSLRNAPK